MGQLMSSSRESGTLATAMDTVYPSGRQPVRLTSENIKEVIERYDTLILDCDGVLWDNDNINKFHGIGDTIDKLREMGKRIIFLSNHPQHTRESFHERFEKLCGFQAKDEDIMLISEATVAYVDHELKSKGKVCVLGSDQIHEALEQMGYDVIGFETDSVPLTGTFKEVIQRLIHTDLDSDVKAVILSNDTYLDYSHLFKTANYLQNPECAFIVTSKEERFTRNSRLVPTIDSLLAAMEEASGRKATLIGKPSPYYFRHARNLHPDIDPARTVMVGDRLGSDIAFAGNSGLDSILVFTGEDNEQTTWKAYHKDPNINLPTYMIDGLADIGKML